MDEADILAHYGVKGMHWGQHKARTPAEDAARAKTFKKAAKITAGVAIVGGAALTVHLLSKHGSLPASSLSSGAEKATADRGKKLAKEIAYKNFKKKAAELSADIKNANEEQDAFMRSIGLGAVVNNSKI